MTNRLADNWRPLIAVADKVGGDWPHLVREAAKAHTAAQEENSIRVQALVDAFSIFEERGADQLASAFIAAKMGEMEGRLWPEWNRKGLTAASLAKLLDRFEIAPKQLRNGAGEKQYRGYKKEWFSEAIARYAPQYGEKGEPSPD